MGHYSGLISSMVNSIPDVIDLNFSLAINFRLKIIGLNFGPSILSLNFRGQRDSWASFLLYRLCFLVLFVFHGLRPLGSSLG